MTASDGQLPDRSDGKVEGAILAAQLVFNVTAQDFLTVQRSVFEELGPGERVEDAEAFSEAVLYFGEKRVIAVRSQGHGALADHAQQRLAEWL